MKYNKFLSRHRAPGAGPLSSGNSPNGMKSLSPELSRGGGTPRDIGSTDINPGRGGIPFPWPDRCPASSCPSSFPPKSDFRFCPTRMSAGKFTLFSQASPKKLHSPPLWIGGVSDHVHPWIPLGRRVSQADLVKELRKRVSLSPVS